jgi:hypothetical protein
MTTTKIAVTALGSIAAVALLAGCGSSPSSAPAAASGSTHAAATRAPATATTPKSSAPASSSGKVPVYKPASVVNNAPHSLILSTPDSPTKVSAFYSSQLGGHGWTTVSKTVTPTSASYTVKKHGRGASVVVSPKGSGSTVSISTYVAP